MPTWGQILTELKGTRTTQGGPDYDQVRRKYLARVHDLSKRAVILYAANFLSPQPLSPLATQVSLQDIDGMMNAVAHVKERELDLILHSPGGSAEAAESIVEYLRQRFDHIRVVVPVAAMSAATMVALGADEILMGQHSQLGPIDPQFTISTPEGPRSSPAKAILDQFDRAKAECRDDPRAVMAWTPILRSYAPGLLEQCEDAIGLAKRIVTDWLGRYMFKGEKDAAGKAATVADWFADYEEFQSHGRRVGLTQLRELGLSVSALEDDQGLQDAVLSVYHTTQHTFGQMMPIGKIIENHLGEALVRFDTSRAMVAVGLPPGGLPPTSPTPGRLPRAERRRRDRDRS